ncbi:sugar transferase [Hoylesella nanceiensis]|uniref:sugar transferase n=1 Tax=Hoylesella nanceiensis TaxID=425941 RepID=UPI0028ED68E8|nr:sugar transferase [Hoylesella nanceiensis]
MTTKKNLDTKTETKTKNEYIYDGMNGLERDVKRIFDFIAAAIALILFSPLFIVCYILIKKEDGGSVIFKQERIGRFGRPFYIYKFRSMQEDAEKNGPALFQHERDHRLTSIGKFLRTHHLDELPQLWNVLVGDMSFVGPRPERKFYIDQIIQHDERYTFLYQVRPGVTSYATLYNGYTDTMDKMLRRLELDLYYLRKRSWWFDIKILINTFLNIAIGKKF